jgi:ABC-type multidrug transport system ATPase subunit/peptidoglycan/LPS O-acetylase OafA/YrhL
MNAPASENRLHALDAVRGFALLLGVAFHAALSFMPGWPPGIWAMNDNSPSQFLSDAAFVTHIFRMSLFFFIAGFFARLLHRKLGTRAFAGNRAMRILLPFILGWVILFPIIGFVWTTGITKVLGGVMPQMPEMPRTFGAFPLTHLWFLYVLMLLYVVTLAIRSLVARLDPAEKLRNAVDTALRSSVTTLLAVFVLGIPLAGALLQLPMWFYWQGIPTPDMSLIPNLPAVVGYGTAFAFGWLVHRSPELLQAIAARWSLYLLFGVLATCYLLYVVKTSPMATPGNTKVMFAYAFGVAVWGWTLGITGAALTYLSNFSPVRRYIADASYWIYLAHLPVVAALQVWVGHWPLHWGVKFPFILVTSFALLFVSYHYLVRPTVIGKLLNGRKYPRKGKGASTPSSDQPSPDQPTPGQPSPASPSAGGGGTLRAVARLRGITKRYGTVAALTNIDIEVRAGELLAVLGPNGAGKSTAISLWLGLNEADQGEVTLLGGSPQDIEQRRRMGVMMQDVELPKELRARELVALATSYYANPLSVEEALERAGITQIADRPYGKLSGGQKRQVQFAVAICGRPKILFLDEPTVGLDIKARESLWSSIRNLLSDGCSVVLTTHYLEEAEALADRVVVVSKGRVIASGTVDEMRALVACRQISCETSLSEDEVRAWPGVVGATREESKLRITATDAEAVVRRLLAGDAKLARLDVRQAGLNEAFNELTREAA